MTNDEGNGRSWYKTEYNFGKGRGTTGE